MLTVGHSNKPLAEFLTLLTTHHIDLLADVRSFPMSRHNPQFNREALTQSLRAISIEYRHLRGLGGMRKPQPDSPNTGWRHPSFRGYADYMLTPDFERNLQELLDLEGEHRVATMCAEAVPWRCHRSLIADALTIRAVPVHHILSTAEPQPHRLTAFARVVDGRLIYPDETLGLFTDPEP